MTPLILQVYYFGYVFVIIIIQIINLIIVILITKGYQGFS